MDRFFVQGRQGFDARRKRRFFRWVLRIERISAVILVWIAGALIFYGIYSLAFLKSYLNVERIEVAGELQHLTEEDVLSAAGIAVGDPLLRVPVASVQERLMQNPWIKEAAVHRKFPNRMWIYVREYVPEALVRLEGWHYVDPMGHLFKKLDPADSRNFPVITGLEEEPDLRSRLLEFLKVKKLYESSALGTVYDLSEIHYDPNGGVSVVTLHDPMELRLGFGPFMEPFLRLETVFEAVSSRGGVVSYIDLGPEGKVVVKYGS